MELSGWVATFLEMGSALLTKRNNGMDKRAKIIVSVCVGSVGAQLRGFHHRLCQWVSNHNGGKQTQSTTKTQQLSGVVLIVLLCVMLEAGLNVVIMGDFASEMYCRSWNVSLGITAGTLDSTVAEIHNQSCTKTEPKWARSHIPGILDNHDLTEGGSSMH